MNGSDRAALYRKRALEAESKAFFARSEVMRRSWLILARDWTKMAEEAETATSTVPSQEVAPPSLDELMCSVERALANFRNGAERSAMDTRRGRQLAR